MNEEAYQQRVVDSTMWLSKGRRTLVAITLRLCTTRFWLMELDRDQVHSLGEK